MSLTGQREISLNDAMQLLIVALAGSDGCAQIELTVFPLSASEMLQTPSEK